jgi:hypothetical protein
VALGVLRAVQLNRRARVVFHACPFLQPYPGEGTVREKGGFARVLLDTTNSQKSDLLGHDMGNGDNHA